MRRGRLDFRVDRDGILHAVVGKVCRASGLVGGERGRASLTGPKGPLPAVIGAVCEAWESHCCIRLTLSGDPLRLTCLCILSPPLMCLCILSPLPFRSASLATTSQLTWVCLSRLYWHCGLDPLGGAAFRVRLGEARTSGGGGRGHRVRGCQPPRLHTDHRIFHTLPSSMLRTELISGCGGVTSCPAAPYAALPFNLPCHEVCPSPHMHVQAT